MTEPSIGSIEIGNSGCPVVFVATDIPPGGIEVYVTPPTVMLVAFEGIVEIRIEAIVPSTSVPLN